MASHTAKQQETSDLVALKETVGSTADKNNTPTSKSVVVSARAAYSSSENSSQKNSSQKR